MIIYRRHKTHSVTVYCWPALLGFYPGPGAGRASFCGHGEQRAAASAGSRAAELSCQLCCSFYVLRCQNRCIVMLRCSLVFHPHVVILVERLGIQISFSLPLSLFFFLLNPDFVSSVYLISCYLIRVKFLMQLFKKCKRKLSIWNKFKSDSCVNIK